MQPESLVGQRLIGTGRDLYRGDLMNEEMINQEISPQNLTEVDGLTPVQQQAAILLAGGLPLQQVANAIDYSRAAVSGWFNNDQNFIDAVTALRRRLLEAQLDELARLRSKALRVIGAALDADDSTALAAAKVILSLPSPRVVTVERRVALSARDSEQLEQLLELRNKDSVKWE